MKKKKIVSIMLGIIIIIIAISMPFHLKQVCYEYLTDMHEGVNSVEFGVWNVVKVLATFYSIAICVLTLILVFINIPKKSK